LTPQTVKDEPRMNHIPNSPIGLLSKDYFYIMGAAFGFAYGSNDVFYNPTAIQSHGNQICRDEKTIKIPSGPPGTIRSSIFYQPKGLSNLVQIVEKRLLSASKCAEGLTHAILAEAFRGELVPTEAELALRDGRSYEPACSLLDRIKAERNIPSAPASKKQRKRVSNKT
jgi:hypothetical protein